MRNDFLIVALDTPEPREALKWAALLRPRVTMFKVGMELFFRDPGVIHELHDSGSGIFLDLKLNDIPATVAGAVRSLAVYKPEILTLFCGPDSARAADTARCEYTPGTLLVNVTILTSEQSTGDSVSKVLKRAEISRAAGLDGVVCAGTETKAVRERVGRIMKIINPGIRPAGAAAHDQVRIVTPAEALRAGASHIVVGRPITRAADPLAETEKILEELRAAGSAPS